MAYERDTVAYEWLLENCTSIEGNLLFHTNDSIKNNQLNFLTQHFQSIQPKKILEIGTNCCCFGYFVRSILPECKLITVGIDAWSQKMVNYLNNVYGDYITFICGDSQQVMSSITDNDINLAWVDGCHQKQCALSDLNQCARLNINHIFVDDYQYSEVDNAVQDFITNNTNYIIKDMLKDNSRDIVYIIKQ